MRALGVLVSLWLILCVGGPAAAAEDLSGLWRARQDFGPEARGPLILTRHGSGYTADLAGRRVETRVERGELVFDMPNGQGTFRGKWERGGLVGHWFQPKGAAFSIGSVYASPVRLRPDGAGRWVGEVAPFDETFTFYLLLKREPDGSFSALARNPERDYGGQRRVRRLEVDGEALRLIGGRGKDEVVAIGLYKPADKVLTLSFSGRGGWSYDFTRDDDESRFYPRGRTPARYVYSPPPARADGWPTGSLREAGIDTASIERMVQSLLEEPMDSPDAFQVHGLLIARHGKLVFEEYFHGESRDRLHETRSAGKSVTSTLVGAAIHAGAPLKLSDPATTTIPTRPPMRTPCRIRTPSRTTTASSCAPRWPTTPAARPSIAAAAPTSRSAWSVARSARTRATPSTGCSASP